VDHLVPFNGMHRYIPALLLQAGYAFTEIPVNHRQRLAGVSKYTNWERALRGLYDLVGVSWLIKRKVRFDVSST
jgi:dolichol-phosphate mannosyltransferase